MTSAQFAAILATMGLPLVAQGVAWAWLYRRVQTLTNQNNARPVEPTSRADPSIRVLEAQLARLEAAIGAGPDARGRSTSLSPDAKRLRRLDRRQVASADGPVLIAVPSLAAPPSATLMAAAAVEFDRRFGLIWALADAGNSLDEIARQTGYPVGQVELILGLRGSRSGSSHEGVSAASDPGETDV